MSFSGKNDEVVYILVSIKLHVVNYINGHYVCDLLYYRTGTWRNCDYDTVTNYSGYLENVYADLSNENKQKWGDFIMNKSDSIVSMLYINRDILESRTYYLFYREISI